MDFKTRQAYNSASEQYTHGWLTQKSPEEIYRVVQKYFAAGKLCADIGSGSGRDVAWLNAHGYPCEGFDASEGLLASARKKFPDFRFSYAELPQLQEIPNARFENVLCETVIMHLPTSDHMRALQNLLRILKPEGVLSLSWRHPISEASDRDEAGRLYAVVDLEAFKAYAASVDVQLLEESTRISTSSGKLITQLVFRK